uniref:RING-type E3 ubiquitin transferase BRCA1 n=1 Tax=Hyaloperonospora arabidopsidis (strain Emoy2) TaxID=559515 RepID=M4B860_HYAAE
MALLSPSRLEALRLIREQLRCTLCDQMFQDPQCLDCKHNFCRPCILLHLKHNNSYCPNCHLPTRPSEVTRNQFLESLLTAWTHVEKELAALNGDKKLHAAKYTVKDTDEALYRALNNGTSTIPMLTGTEARQRVEAKQATRGRVANHKWDIDTQEIRQELKLEQRYMPQQHPGSRQQESTNQWKKTNSSDLPENYKGSSSGARGRELSREGSGYRRSGSRKRDKKQSVRSLDEVSAVESIDMETGIGDGEDDDDGETGWEGPTSRTSTPCLMATQEVESYMDRIAKQREALSQWEKSRAGKSDGMSSLLELERSLQSSNGFDELLKERRRESQYCNLFDDSDTLTQMTQVPPLTSVFDSPDLLAAFRRRKYIHNDESEKDRRSASQGIPSIPPPPLLHARGRISSPSRKRLRMPVSENKQPTCHRFVSTIDPSSKGLDTDNKDEIRDRRPATNANYKDADDEEEYEMKPSVPIPLTPEHSSFRADQHCKHPDVLSQTGKRPSGNFRTGTALFQVEDKYHRGNLDSQATKRLVCSASVIRTSNGADAAQRESDIARPNSAASLCKPTVHTSKGPAKTSVGNSGFVFVSSDLTREEVKRVLEATQQLGGKFGHDFDLKRDPVTGHFCTSVTHLITKAVPPIGAISGAEPDELRCKRTAKYMRGLAEGSFVMDFSWITASLSAGRWLTEEPFEMVGDIYSNAIGKPHEGRLRRVQTGRRNSIFSMLSFVLLVSESEFDFQFNSVKALVNNFGGTVVRAESFIKAKTNSKQRLRRTPVGVVSKNTLPSEATAKWEQFQIPIVRITWIFDSVSHLEVLPFDDYYPY